MVAGTRMSGDYDTALGNTMINWLVLRSWLNKAKIKGQMLIDGDDSVIIIERSDYKKLDFDHFGKMGFITKIEVVHELHQVEFCQSKYLPSSNPIFSRNPRRALSHMMISLRKYHGDQWLRYLAGVGKGELVASAGVPMISVVAQKLAQLSDKPIYDTDSWYKSTIKSEFVPITLEARVAFADAWDIDIDSQIRFESEFTPPLQGDDIRFIEQYNCLCGNSNA